MKPALLLSILAMLILSSCASLPTLTPVSPVDTSRCGRPFVTGQQQFVHAIVATLPGGDNSLITGITTISSAQASVHAVIMTLEGLVLFEGKIKGEKIDVLRSISFFSKPAFAEGLLNDVRLIFLKPAGALLEVGRSEQGALVCRYRNINKSTVDVIINPDGNWKLVQYDAGFHPRRRVTAQYGGAGPLPVRKNAPDRIEIVVTGTFGYTLDMQLIQ